MTFRIKPLHTAIVLMAGFTPFAAQAVDVPIRSDSYIDTAAPLGNYGKATTLLINSSSKTGLLKFKPIATFLPTGATSAIIEKALLHVWVKSTTDTSARFIVQKSLTDWAEGTVIVSNAPSLDTGFPPATDSTNIAAVSQWYSLDITDIVKYWADNPADTGRSIVLTTTAGEISMDTKENIDTSRAAYIDITLKGPAGPTGATGSTGAPGTAGADGKTVLNGTVAPDNGVGSDGDFYIDTATNMIYGPKAAGAWGSGTSLIGPAGSNGANGANGSNGSNGSNGTDGVNAYTAVGAGYVQPAASATVSVTVGSTAWLSVGQVVYVGNGGGYYTVDSITDGTTVVLNNLDYPGNAAPTTTIPFGSSVSAGGLQGPAASSAVTSVGVTAPVVNTGTASAPVIGLPVATSNDDGYLSAADWIAFNSKLSANGDGSALTGITGSQISGNIAGNAGTATALAANGTDCAAGEYARGVDASGNAEGCTTAAGGSGTVTSITAGTGLNGGTITGSGTISLANTFVTPGTYSYPTISVNQQGQITSAASGSAVSSVGASSPLSSTGGTTPTISLQNSGVSAGSYTNANITVDATGRVTSASSGSSGGSTPTYSSSTNQGTAINPTDTALNDVGTFSMASNGIATVVLNSGSANTLRLVAITDTSNNIYATGMLSGNPGIATGGSFSVTAVLPSGNYKVRFAQTTANSVSSGTFNVRKLLFN